MRILAVTCVRNEGPYLIEWIGHLRALGVTDFLIYSNDCNDGSDIMLDLLDQHGVITHIRQKLSPDDRPQWVALRDAWARPVMHQIDWCVVCDVDEFINIKVGQGRFDDLCAAVPPDTSAIAMPWRLFGNAGVVGFSDTPVVTQFTRAAPQTMAFPLSAHFFKSLFRPSAGFTGLGVHRPKQDGETRYIWADGSGQKMPEKYAGNDRRMNLTGMVPAREMVECHHYSIKSVESFLIKSARGLPNHIDKPVGLSYWVNRNFNQQANDSLIQRQVMFAAQASEIKSLSGVSAAHEACVKWYKHAARRTLADPETFQMFCDILVVANSQDIGPERARMISALYKKMMGA